MRRVVLRFAVVVSVGGAGLALAACDGDMGSFATPTAIATVAPAGIGGEASSPSALPTIVPVPIATALPTVAPAQATPPPVVNTPAPAVSTPPPAAATSGFDHQAAKDAGATAICNDGTWSYSAHRSGTCSHHGGVNWWTGNV
ncbi:MAG: DUF3761 domain-containing protein [Candidatus Dormibacteria bacterium]